MSTAAFARRVALTLALVTALVLAWKLGEVLLLGFGAIVLAVVLRAAGHGVARLAPIPVQWSVVLVVLVLVAALALLANLLGAQVAGEISQLRERIPEALQKGREWMEQSAAGRTALESLSDAKGDLVSTDSALSTASGTLSALATTALVVLLAIYLAFNPHLYMRGLVHLAPAHRQEMLRRELAAAADALHRWMLGQGISMLVVGVLTGLGLWLIGIPMALTLALIAALFEFVPVIGPLAAAVPALLVAFAQGPSEALWVAALYLGVQQLEGYVIHPLAQRWAVRLPPALGLLAIVAFGTLFGLPGLLFATPLTVVLMVFAQRRLAVRDGQLARTGSGAAQPKASD